MTAHAMPSASSGLLTPSRVASYITKLEKTLGRAVGGATINPDGSIDIRMSRDDKHVNPADLVDMDD